MKLSKVHFEGSGATVYPATIITACGVNGYRIEDHSNEFEDAMGTRFEFSNAKRDVTCLRCKKSNDFKLS